MSLISIIKYICVPFLASGGSLQCPWGPLGVTRAPWLLKMSIRRAFGEPFGNPFGDLVGILFLLWAPLGPLLRGFGSNVLAVLVAPGLGLVLRHQIYMKFVDFWVDKCG